MHCDVDAERASLSAADGCICCLDCCRCAAADFSYAYLVPAAGPSGYQQVYANVTYQQPADGSVQQCSGYLATDITWTMDADAPNSSSSSSNSSLGQPVWSGGSPGDGWSCPVQPQQYAPFGTFCAALGNPNNGMTSFDTIVWAWVTIFQCITTEGYTDIMYALQVRGTAGDASICVLNLICLLLGCASTPC